MILHLLAPDSGMINKSKQEWWQYIEEKLSPILSQTAVNAKVEEYTWYMNIVAVELATLVKQKVTGSGRFCRKHNRRFLQ